MKRLGSPVFLDESAQKFKISRWSDVLYISNEGNGPINKNMLKKEVGLFFENGGRHLHICESSKLEDIPFDISNVESLYVSNRNLQDLSQFRKSKKLRSLYLKTNAPRKFELLVPKLDMLVVDFESRKTDVALQFSKEIGGSFIRRVDLLNYPLPDYSPFSRMKSEFLRIRSRALVFVNGLSTKYLQFQDCTNLAKFHKVSCRSLRMDCCNNIAPEEISAVINLKYLEFRTLKESPRSWSWLRENKAIYDICISGKGNDIDLVKMKKIKTATFWSTDIKQEKALKLSKINPTVLISLSGDKNYYGGERIDENRYRELAAALRRARV